MESWLGGLLRKLACTEYGKATAGMDVVEEHSLFNRLESLMAWVPIDTLDLGFFLTRIHGQGAYPWITAHGR